MHERITYIRGSSALIFLATNQRAQVYHITRDLSTKECVHVYVIQRV